MALLTLAILIGCATSPEIAENLLIGKWEIQSSEPFMSPHHSFAFFDDSSFVIYDKQGRVLEKNKMIDLTDHSFVGFTQYTAGHHPLPEIVGKSTYAIYEFSAEDSLVLRFYDDPSMRTKYVVFYLDRVSSVASKKTEAEADHQSTSPTENGVFGGHDCSSVVRIDFDSTIPDGEYSREGAQLNIRYDPDINDSGMGVITVPGGQGGGPGSRPYATFRIDYQGRLGDTIAGFRAYIPNAAYRWRSPYIVFAINADDDPQQEGYVVGGGGVRSGTGPHPVETWYDFRLDMDTPVHVADYRKNLGSKFTPGYMGSFADLVKTPLSEERTWGDLQIVFVGVSAGAWGGSAFEAYVDDLTVCTIRQLESETFDSRLTNLFREITAELEGNVRGAVAVCGFADTEGQGSEFTALCDEMVMLEFAGLPSVQVIEQDEIDRALSETSLSLSDLLDTGHAEKFGNQLNADYIFTGSVIEMPSSIVVFGRVLEVWTGRIVTAKQVNISKDADLQVLLQ
jgi:hypothetical protein